MGRILNPDNGGFTKILATKYVDKTGLISEFDLTMDTTDGLVLSTRPRRFGKSYAALSLVAFYSCGCDSRSLFEGLEVSRREGWDAHLNAYNVVQLDMTGVIEGAKKAAEAARATDASATAGQPSWSALVVPTATRWILEELREIMPDAGIRTGASDIVLTNAILDVVGATGKKFVFVIDEWDAPYRLAENDTVSQEDYADWLRSLFKDITFTSQAIAGAYMTGILPIKKYSHQSAVSDFHEFTMLRPGPYAPYMGFTEAEVLELSREGCLDPVEMRRFYDGYTLRYVGRVEDDRRRRIAVEAYSPYSVM